MSRIPATFERLAAAGRAGLIPYLTAGDPDLATTRDCVLAAEDAGADLLELGIPFSDPMADGPVIQRSAVRALAANTSLHRVLELVAELRLRIAMPIVLFGYHNPFLQYDLAALGRDAAAAGADGLLCVDAPPEEAGELRSAAQTNGLDLIPLLAPDHAAGARAIARNATGFLYFVSVLGVTGARDRLPPELPDMIARVRRVTTLPLGVGFGVQTPEQAGWVATFADAVIVGSALVRELEAGAAAEAPARVGRLVASLRDGIRAAGRGRSVDAYAETVAYLSGLEVARGWDLSLDRMRAALARRGHPENALAAVHVAGTNGKGSTAAMIEACLGAAGWRTALFTSPHLVDFAERIRAGGRTMPRDDLVALTAELRAAMEGAGIALTHFEFVTLLAFEWFARIGVDVAVVEVGLGGRLDATNVVVPRLSIVTSIARDHEAFLGERIDQIAAEKAGIVKPGVPVCVGRLVPEAATVVCERAAALGAPLLRAGIDGTLGAEADGLVFRAPGVLWDRLRVGLRGAFQGDNAELALLALSALRAALACDVTAIRAGLADVRWPGRLAVVRESPRVVLDGAHNPAAAAALAAELPALLQGRETTLVFAAMQDKRWAEELDVLLPHVTEVVVTRVGRRAEQPERIAGHVAGRRPVAVAAEPRRAVRDAIARASPARAVLVTGSLFLVGEAYAELDTTLFETWHGWEGDGTEPRR